MKKKLRVGIIFGGKSAEHEVSLQSAKNIVAAMDRKKYNTVLLFVDKRGQWFLQDSLDHGKTKESITLVPCGCGRIIGLGSRKKDIRVDVIFPVMHGPFGEDGTMQGLLKLAGVPFVGSSVLGSAVGMDKDVMKRLLRDADIPVAKFLAITEKDVPSYEEITKSLGVPFFVKPANLGSSVGVSKVRNKKEFRKALRTAFSYDRKVLLEENIDGREIECSVLGNDNPRASVPGEIVCHNDFYSYQAKYKDARGAELQIPARVSARIAKIIQALAVKTFSTLGCEGLGRVDFFLTRNGSVLVNEINTLPGFTSVSMYPKLWEASGISPSALVDRLIALALERHAREQKLTTSYT